MSTPSGPPSRLRTCLPDSISPTPTSTPSDCRSRNWPSCAGPRRSGGTSSRSAPAGSTTAASGWCPSTRTSKRSRCAATSSPACRTPRCPGTKTARRRADRDAARSCCSTWTRRSTPGCARSSPAASRPAPSSGSATTSTNAPSTSSKPRRRKAPATSSNRWPASCRCRPSPGCSGCRKRTAQALPLVEPDGRRRGPRVRRQRLHGASVELITYAMQMAADRAQNPGDDIVTKLIEADIDGQKLSDDEFGFFVILLAVAGNETTRNSITQGMMAFTDFPDQWELYKKERPVPPPTRSSGGPPRSRRSSGPRSRTTSCPACRSRRVSGS